MRKASTTHSDTKSDSANKTIRQVRNEQLENVNKERKELAKWALHKNATPTKPIASVELLKRRINNFFKTYDDVVPPTPYDLAIYLGYSSEQGIYRDIKSHVEPEYSAELEKACALCKNHVAKEMMRMSYKSDDYRGYLEFLKRMDADQAKAEGLNEMGGSIAGRDVNIQINLNQKEKLSALINDSIGSVMDAIILDEEEDD